MALRLTAGAVLGLLAGAAAWPPVSSAVLRPLGLGDPATTFRAFAFVWGGFLLSGALAGAAVAFHTRRRSDP